MRRRGTMAATAARDRFFLHAEDNTTGLVLGNGVGLRLRISSKP